MNRAVVASAAAALIAAAGIAFVVAGPQRPASRAVAMIGRAAAEESRAPIYFQDPDGKPLYSLTPRKTPDGRDYRAVPAGADVSFDDDAPSAIPPATAATGGSGERKIKYYRNPMGLPDTSPTPKKDSMGMDYIPVYEGDDSDDGSVKLSPGKIQRTGVKSEPAAKRVIRTIVRAPGTIQLDERRISVIAMRSESFVLKVANVTTGSHVVKGQPLMEVYSPAVSSAAAEYLATITSKTTGGDAVYGRGSRQRLMNLDVPEAAIAAIEKSRNVPTSIEWTAPRDGIVLERNAIEGMRVQPGDVLFRIADHSVVWALIDVAERDLGAIAIGPAGDRAGAELSRTRVLREGRRHLSADQQGDAHGARPHRTAESRPGRCCTTCTSTPKSTPAAASRSLSVPESAVIDTGSRQAVFVDKGEGRFEPREVKLGHRGDGYRRDPAGHRRRRARRRLGELPDRRRKQSEGRAEGLFRGERQQ